MSAAYLAPLGLITLVAIGVVVLVVLLRERP